MVVQQRWVLIALALITMVALYFISSVLAPFVVSAVLAYLGDPLADRLEKAGLSRALAVCMVFLAIVLIVVAILLVIVPLVFQQLKALIQLLPVWESWLQINLWPLLHKYLNLDPQLFDVSAMVKEFAGKWQKTGGLIAYLGMSVTRSSIALIDFLVNLFLIPVVTFYLLRDWNTIMGNLRLLLPRRIEFAAVGLAKDCDEVLAAFLKGQLMVMLALGVIYSIGLSLVGLKFAILIGLMAGLVSIIPYMGFVTGFFTALIVALFQFDSVWLIVGVVSVFIIGQVLEGGFLTPNLVGDSLGLHPVAVIFSLMAGGQLFGVIGMLIALPLAAIIVVLLRHLHRNYKESPLYYAKQHK